MMAPKIALANSSDIHSRTGCRPLLVGPAPARSKLRCKSKKRTTAQQAKAKEAVRWSRSDIFEPCTLRRRSQDREYRIYTIGGVLNGSLSIPAGGFGVFLKVDQTLDWRAEAFT